MTDKLLLIDPEQNSVKASFLFQRIMLAVNGHAVEDIIVALNNHMGLALSLMMIARGADEDETVRAIDEISIDMASAVRLNFERAKRMHERRSAAAVFEVGVSAKEG